MDSLQQFPFCSLFTIVPPISLHLATASSVPSFFICLISIYLSIHLSSSRISLTLSLSLSVTASLTLALPLPILCFTAFLCKSSDKPGTTYHNTDFLFSNITMHYYYPTIS